MSTQPLPSEPSPDSPGTSAAGSRRLTWRPQTVFIAVIVIAVIAALIVVAASGGHAHSGANTSAVSVSAGSVTRVDLQGVPGQLAIVGAATGRVTLNGQLDWSGHASPVSSTRIVNAHTLRLVYRCAAASPCTAHWRLVVPWRTAVALSQPSGHVTVSDLAGPLQITATSVDISATGLRSPSLTAVITSGHLAATFAAAPRKVNITLTSAQATLMLPANLSYAVSDQVTSGYIHVGIPEASAAPRAVTARVVSGELELLPT